MFPLDQRPIGFDDMADVRYLHRSAFQVGSADYHTDDEINAYLERIHSIEYIKECMNCSLYGIWHDKLLIGTAGWSTAHENRSTARIEKIFVHHFYLGLGLGRLMVEHTEERARNAGFKDYSVRAASNSAKFFNSIGYDVSSHGALGLARGTNLPVIYMRKSASHKTGPQRTGSPHDYSESPQRHISLKSKAEKIEV